MIQIFWDKKNIEKKILDLELHNDIWDVIKSSSKKQTKAKMEREKKNYTKRLLLNKAVTQHNEQLTWILGENLCKTYIYWEINNQNIQPNTNNINTSILKWVKDWKCISLKSDTLWIWMRIFPQAYIFEHLFPCWWHHLERFRWYNLAGK